MNKKIVNFLFLLITFALPLFAAQPNPTLLVGTNAEFPPYSFIQNGKIVGFDIDIANEIAKRMDKEIKFKDMPFDSLIPDLTLGRVDFVAAGMTSTPERAERVLFTKPYMTDDPLVVLSLKEKANEEPLTLQNFSEKFAGKTIIVNEGFTADIALSTLKGFKLVRLATTADGFLALKSGRANAFVTAKSTIDSFLETQKNTEFQENVIQGTAENCVIAVSKKNPEMLKKIQMILDAMEQDGTLKTLKMKWKIQ